MKRIPAKALSDYHELVGAGSAVARKRPAEGTLSMRVPVRLSTGDNRREAWVKRDERVYAERRAVSEAWMFNRWPKGMRPLEVIITRCAPRRLDAANLGSACKSVIDQLAAEMGVNDRVFVLDDDEQGIRLRLKQRTTRVHGVEITVRWT